MSYYTQEEIEEMRKRLPFKAVVWEHTENKKETTIAHIFDDGDCADNECVHSNFKELKEPEYVPFTQETIKPFRDEWVSCGGDDFKIQRVSTNGVYFISSDQRTLFANFTTILKDWKFADTGKPFGKEVE